MTNKGKYFSLQYWILEGEAIYRIIHFMITKPEYLKLYLCLLNQVEKRQNEKYSRLQTVALGLYKSVNNNISLLSWSSWDGDKGTTSIKPVCGYKFHISQTKHQSLFTLCSYIEFDSLRIIHQQYNAIYDLTQRNQAYSIYVK